MSLKLKILLSVLAVAVIACVVIIYKNAVHVEELYFGNLPEEKTVPVEPIKATGNIDDVFSAIDQELTEESAFIDQEILDLIVAESDEIEIGSFGDTYDENEF